MPGNVYTIAHTRRDDAMSHYAAADDLSSNLPIFRPWPIHHIDEWPRQIAILLDHAADRLPATSGNKVYGHIAQRPNLATHQPEI